jgi:hypothetical protein
MSVLNRITIFEFDFLKAHLSKFLQENPNITYDLILGEWLKKMENIISSENRYSYFLLEKLIRLLYQIS